MEIKRKLEMFVTENRRFIIPQPQSNEPVFCADCGAETLTAQQAAHAPTFAANKRRIYETL